MYVQATEMTGMSMLGTMSVGGTQNDCGSQQQDEQHQNDEGMGSLECDAHDSHVAAFAPPNRALLGGLQSAERCLDGDSQ